MWFFLPVATFVHRLRIFNPMMKNCSENPVETLCYLVEVFEGQFALIELAIGENFIDQFLNHPLNTIRSWVDQGPRGSFNGIGEHNQTGFTGLGLGPG